MIHHVKAWTAAAEQALPPNFGRFKSFGAANYKCM